VKLCAGWGLSPSDLEQAPPAVETLAYTRYVLDAGMRGDLLALKGRLPLRDWLRRDRRRGSPRGPMRTLQRNHIAFGSPSMPVHHTRRSRRKRGRTWRVSPNLYVTPAREARADRDFQGSHRGSRPTSGKWAGAAANVLNSR